MRSEHVKYFITLAETRSITQASLLLHTTHQNVSKIIRQLEDEMGAKLFTRTQKGLILTESGSAMLDLAQNVLDQFNKTRATIAVIENNHSVSGNLQLYSSNVSNISYLFALVQSFNEYYPNVSIRLHEWGPIEILQTIALHPNQLGIAPIITNADFQDIYAPYLNLLQVTPLTNDEFICIVNTNSPLAQKKNVSIAEFLQYPITFVQNSAENMPPLLNILNRFGTPQIGMISNNTQLYVNAILSGRYVGFSSHHAHAKNSPSYNNQLICVPFQENMHFQVCLITHSKPELPPITQAFIDFVHNNYPQISK